MTYELHPATIEDVPTLVTVFDEAFADDEIVSYLFKDVPEHIRRERDLKWFSTFFQKLDSNGVQFTKVIDTSNGYNLVPLSSEAECNSSVLCWAVLRYDINRAIAGFAKWDTPIVLTAELRAERELEVKKKEPYPEGANVPLLEDFFGQLDRGKRKWIDAEKDTCNTSILMIVNFQAFSTRCFNSAIYSLLHCGENVLTRLQMYTFLLCGQGTIGLVLVQCLSKPD